MSKSLDRLSKILAQAENAGTPEEAETFMAKALEYAAGNGLDLAVARMHQAKKEKVQEPEERRIQVNPYNRRQNRKHFAELAMAICDVNDVEYLIGGNEYALFCVGFPEDLDVVEALFTHLSIQMVNECNEALKRGDNKEWRNVAKKERVEIPWDERAWGEWDPSSPFSYDRYFDEADEWDRETNSYVGRWPNQSNPPPRYNLVKVRDADGQVVFERKQVSAVDGRVFRHGFYQAFVAQMRGRLWEARMAAERERGELETAATSGEMALALRDKKEEVKAAHDEQRAKVKHLGTYKHAVEDDRQDDYTGKGARSGVKAANDTAIGETGRGVASA